MKKTIIIISVVLALVLLTFATYFLIDFLTISPETKLYFERRKHIQTSMSELIDGDEKQVDINNIIPFEWDIAYVFMSDMKQEEFDEYTNYKIENIVELHLETQEGDNPPWHDIPFPILCFVKDDKMIFHMRTDGFELTGIEKKDYRIETFSFTPDNAIFDIYQNDYGVLIMIHKGN